MKRDWYDIVDLVLKFAGGVLLAFVTLYINTANDLQKKSNELKQQEIGNSLRFGEFTKSLFQDLLSKDTAILRRDLALTVLNRTLGQTDTALIVDISYCLISDYYQSSEHKKNDQRAIFAAIDIVQEKDSMKYHKVQAIQSKFAETFHRDTDQTQAIKQKDTSALNTVSSETLDKLALIKTKATIFMQIGQEGPEPRAKAQKVLSILKSNGFSTPGIEVITRFKFPDAIKYFYDEDEDVAKTIQKIINSNFKTGSIPIKKFNNAKARPGIVEVWCNF